MKKYFPFLIIFLILFGYLSYYFGGGFIGDFGDPVGQTIPNKFLLIEFLRNGILPLWNPLSFLGMPFLADIQVGTFYAPDLIFFGLFDPFVAHNISVLFHVIFASLGVYFLFRKLTGSEESAFVCAIIFGLTGSLLTKVVYLNYLETIAYLPWLLLVIFQAKRVFLFLPLLIALMIFAGHPVAVFYVFLIVFIFCCFHVRSFRRFFSILVSFVIGLLISAVQLVPFLEFKNSSVRSAISYNDFVAGSLNIFHYFGFLNPFKLGISNVWDKYVHFGTLAFLIFVVSLFFYGKYSDKMKKLYFTGLVLCVVGLVLSVIGTVPFLAKIVFELPLFNLARVPARYILLFHLGSLMCLGVFLANLFVWRKKSFYILGGLIVLNSLFVTNLFLERFEIVDGRAQYEFDASEIIKADSNEELSLFVEPKYFLSSSYFLFPNRHVLSFMPSMIGYNPMIPKIFDKNFVYLPVGAFGNPNYFIDYHDRFLRLGLNYYIFPNEKFLEEVGLPEKKLVITYLKDHGWEKIGELESGGEVWKSSSANPFAYFLNSENSVEVVEFEPGRVKFDVSLVEDDVLVVNQSYYDGWFDSDGTSAKIYDDLVQSYNVKTGTNSFEIHFRPRSFVVGFWVSIFGVFLYALTGFLTRRS